MVKTENEKLHKELEAVKKELANTKNKLVWSECGRNYYKKLKNNMYVNLCATNGSMMLTQSQNEKLKTKNEQLRKDMEKAKELLKLAEFYMSSGQDIHLIYPQWFKDYYDAVDKIQKFLDEHKED